MATRRYTGNAPSVRRVRRITPGVGSLTGLPIRIGIPGGPYLDFTGWTAATIVAAWNAMNHPFFKEVVASVNSTSVVLTHNALGADFDIYTYVDDGSDPFALVKTDDVSGSGPGFFMHPDNWEDRIVPDSGDTIVCDDISAGIQYQLDLVQSFIVADSDTETLFMLGGEQLLFREGQKVSIASAGTLPTGLTAGFYYIRNPGEDGTFNLSSTVDGSLILTSDAGTGVHTVWLSGLTFVSYQRYTASIGLPHLRGNIPEYMPQYLHAGFAAIKLAADVQLGSGLTMGRFDLHTTEATDVLIYKNQSSTISGIPSVLMKGGHASTTVDLRSGQLGLGVYDGETFECDNIKAAEGTTLVACNTTTHNPSDIRGDFRSDNSTFDALTTFA